MLFYHRYATSKNVYSSLFRLNQLLLPDGFYLFWAHALPPVRNDPVRAKAADGGVTVFCEEVTIDHVVDFHLLILVVPSLLHASPDVLFSSLRNISIFYFLKYTDIVPAAY